VQFIVKETNSMFLGECHYAATAVAYIIYSDR